MKKNSTAAPVNSDYFPASWRQFVLRDQTEMWLPKKLEAPQPLQPDNLAAAAALLRRPTLPPAGRFRNPLHRQEEEDQEVVGSIWRQE